jgi:shikimate kinase/3-dehydroquinate synthase
MINLVPNNLILIGFMASGKSHVGKLLASNLGFELIDLDSLIELRLNKSIKDIFAAHGEAYFRECEYQTLLSLEGRENCVIVSGGGTPINFQSAEALKKLGTIFFLDASFELIEKRLANGTKRPLANLSSKAQTNSLQTLYRFRRPIYRSLGQPIQVEHENSKKTAKEICERFLARAKIAALNSILVPDEFHPYEIKIGHGALKHLPSLITSLGLSEHRIALLTSPKIEKALAPQLKELRPALPGLILISVNDGEEHKNYSTINHIHEQLLAHGFTRSSLIIALGGGTIGDMAGFAAAIYLRGIPLIQVPTTLLAMVDSSVGGKTGIDAKEGKNLIGAFHMPRAVLIDPELLSTLPADEYACGMAEVIKHAIIGDKTLFSDLLQGSIEGVELISRAIMVKVKTVIDDPFEFHKRAHLNLGHTFAHALEKASRYQIKHGQAVAIGLMLAADLSARLGLLEEDFSGELKKLLNHYQLPTEIPDFISTKELLEAMTHDKKRNNDGLRFIVPHKLGSVSICQVQESKIFGK